MFVVINFRASLKLGHFGSKEGHQAKSKENLVDTLQGGHALWKTGKTGKMVEKKSLQGKIREFEILLKIRGKSGNFKKSYLCKVKIFKCYSCSDVATGGFFLPYA